MTESGITTKKIDTGATNHDGKPLTGYLVTEGDTVLGIVYQREQRHTHTGGALAIGYSYRTQWIAQSEARWSEALGRYALLRPERHREAQTFSTKARAVSALAS